MLDKEEYKKLYDLTGLDIDGRRKSVLQHIPLMERGVIKVINFVKSFPGFKQLVQDDQITLLKGDNPISVNLYCKYYNIYITFVSNSLLILIHIVLFV